MDPHAQKMMLLERRKQILEQAGKNTAKTVLAASSSHSSANQTQASLQTSQSSATSLQNNKLFSNDGSFLERFREIQKQNENAGNKTNSIDKVSIKVSANKPIQQLSSRSALPFEESNNSRKNQEDKSASSLSKHAADRRGNDIDALVRMQYQSEQNYSSQAPAFAVQESAHSNLERQGQPLQSKDRSQRKKRRWDSDKEETTGSTSSSSATTADPSPEDIMAEFEKAKAIAQAKARELRGTAMSHTPMANVVSPPMSNKEQGVYNQLVNMCESGTDKISNYNSNQQAAIQQEIHALYKRIIAEQQIKEVVTQAAAPSNKPKYEYDSDEDLDGGTWEHKKRKKEMEKTRDMAQQLTQANRGKHFIGDFLPLKELQKFLEKVKAIKEGRDPDLSDYSDNKLTDGNLGYRMLQQAGWQEGQGLGSTGKGITAPINQGSSAFQNAGLGTEKPHEVEKEDSEFDLYRKRMMLAYRFRPNPMNNPRRPYY